MNEADDLRHVTIEEWLTEWFSAVADEVRELRPDELIEDLATDGWQIVRKEP